METKTILKKAIEKAVENGFEAFGWETFELYYEYACLAGVRFYDVDSDKGTCFSTTEIIFSHDFAKAFWGEKRVENGTNNSIETSYDNWRHHLKIMVLEEEPIKYLEKFI